MKNLTFFYSEESCFPIHPASQISLKASEIQVILAKHLMTIFIQKNEIMRVVQPSSFHQPAPGQIITLLPHQSQWGLSQRQEDSFMQRHIYFKVMAR